MFTLDFSCVCTNAQCGRMQPGRGKIILKSNLSCVFLFSHVTEQRGRAESWPPKYQCVFRSSGLLGEAVEQRLHMSVDAVVAAVRLGERWEKEQGGAGKLSQAGEV